MPFVISTLTSGTDYTDYHDPVSGGANVPKRIVSIKGGANVASKIQALEGHALTLPGIETEISEEDAAFLKNHPVFQQQEKAGYVKLSDKSRNVVEASKDMNGKDPSRPLTEDDTKEGGRIAGAITSKSAKLK